MGRPDVKAFANLSIRNKLVGIILAATVLSVGAGFGLVIWRSIDAFQKDLHETTLMVTEVVTDFSAIDLLFEAPELTQQFTLAPLRNVSSVSDAYLYDAQGELFSEYHRDKTPDTPPPKLPEWPADVDPSVPHCELRDPILHCFGQVFYADPAYAMDEGEGEGEGEDKTTYLGTVYLRASTEELLQQIRGYLWYMAGLAALVVAAAAAVAYPLQEFISKPILHLAAMAKRISRDADYSIRVEKPGNDEIGILYEGFNNMLEQIQVRQGELKRSNRDLDQFAYVASHDLKAPLRAISTLSGWIEEDISDRLSPEGREQLQLLRSRVERMDHLIEGVLQYSRAGRLETQDEEVDVGEMLSEIIDILDPPESFQIEVDPEMPVFDTPRLRLEQVFTNLIQNAIKYHDRPDGRIDVTVRRVGRFYEFAVKDDGPGIAPEHQDKVFMMFQTLQPRDQVESTGLGLSLVKKLVEEEGGSIRLESEPGHGATFRFTWPAVRESESSEVRLS